MSPEEIIRFLELKPHPEGGHYFETYRHESEDGSRGACTGIYFLLREGERSRWHRVDAAEMWHYYAGDPLLLSLCREGNTQRHLTLGPDLAQGARPQLLVQPGEWQAARSLGKWTLVGCTVSPAFEFDGFELAPPGFEP